MEEKSQEIFGIKQRSGVYTSVCTVEVWHLDLFMGTGSGPGSNLIKPVSTTPTTHTHTHTPTKTTFVSLT